MLTQIYVTLWCHYVTMRYSLKQVYKIPVTVLNGIVSEFASLSMPISCKYLTEWGLNKMAAILQMTF